MFLNIVINNNSHDFFKYVNSFKYSSIHYLRCLQEIQFHFSKLSTSPSQEAWNSFRKKSIHINIHQKQYAYTTFVIESHMSNVNIKM